MQMKHRLACPWAHVQDGAISLLDFALTCDLCGSEMTASNNFGIGGLGLFQSGEMTLRNDQDVGGGLGTDIFEGEDMFIFVDFPGRNFAADDAAEEAVRISHSSPGETIALESRGCQA